MSPRGDAACGSPQRAGAAPPARLIRGGRAVLLAGVLLALVLTACGHRRQAGAPSNASAAVVAAWQGYWNDLVEASRTGDWASPLLAAHATGPALEGARGQLRRWDARHLVTEGDVTLRDSRVLSVRGTVAKLRDCVDLASFTPINAKTAKPAEQPASGPVQETATLVLRGGMWKVQLTIVGGPCTS